LNRAEIHKLAFLRLSICVLNVGLTISGLADLPIQGFLAETISLALDAHGDHLETVFNVTGNFNGPGRLGLHYDVGVVKRCIAVILVKAAGGDRTVYWLLVG
jgi:hypothetical protein